MNPQPVLLVGVTVLCAAHGVTALAQVVQSIFEGPGLISLAGLLAVAGFDLWLIRKREAVARRIATPLRRESGHGPEQTLFFAGLSLLGIHLILDSAAVLGPYGGFALLPGGPGAAFTSFLAEPSTAMVCGALMVLLQPVLAHATAPGAED